MTSKEREYFETYASLITNNTKYSFQSLFKLELHLNNSTFEKFLNKNKHEIYHLCYNTEKCCQCSDDTVLPTFQTLNKAHVEVLYHKTKHTQCHVKDKKAHSCGRAKKNISTTIMDFLLAKTLVLKFCMRVFWYSCNTFMDESLNQFLNDNKHIIYHLWKCDYVCCECKSEFKFPSIKPILEETDWDLLFSCKLKACPQDINSQKAICSFHSKDDIHITQLDKRLQEVLLSHCCELRKACASLDRNTSYIYAHVKDGMISLHLYERYVSEITSAITLIAEVCEETTLVQDNLQDLFLRPYREDKFITNTSILLDVITEEQTIVFRHFLEEKHTVETAEAMNSSNNRETPVISLETTDKLEVVCLDEACKLCEERRAEIFCEECDVKLCKICSDRNHTKIKSMINHHVETIQDFSCVKTHCDIHNSTFLKICLNHDTLLCIRCAVEHKLCSTQSIQDGKKGVKESAKATEIELKKENMLQSLENVISQVNDEIMSLPMKKDKFISDIDEIIKTSFEVFNKIKEDGLQEITRHKEMMERVQWYLSVCEEKTERYNFEFAALMKTAPEYTTFLRLNEMDHDLIRIENSYKKVFVENNVSDIDVKTRFPFEKIKDVVLKFERTNIKIPITYSKSQIAIATSKINQIYLQRCVDMNLPTASAPTEIRGCTILNTGEMWFIDRNNKRFICYDINGNFISETTLPRPPSDITFMTDSRVAVSFSGTSSIAIIDTIIRTLQDTFINIESGPVGGLAFYNDKLFVRVIDFGYYIFDSSGNEIKRIEKKNKYVPYITCAKDNFVYAKWDVSKVFCCNLSGDVVWECSVGHILEPPNGVAADTEGNIFVTGSFSNNVVVISADGTNIKELLGKESGLENPMSISYDKTRRKLLVSCSTGLSILYSVQTKTCSRLA